MKATQGTRADAIINWLDDHPGWYTPRQVAAGMDLPTHPVASTLLYLAKRDRVRRLRGGSNGPNTSVYSSMS